MFRGGRPRTDRISAAVANGLAGDWIELDEGFREVPCHAGVYVLPALLAEAETGNLRFGELEQRRERAAGEPLPVRRREGSTLLAVGRARWEMSDHLAGAVLLAREGDVVVAADASLTAIVSP